MPLLRKWFSILSVNFSGGATLGFKVIQFASNETSNPSTTNAVSFATLPKVNSQIFVLASIGGNSADGNPTFSIGDNQSGNTYTSQKVQSGASNGLSAQCWSSKVVGSTGTFTITITESGATTAWGIYTAIYEVQGIASLTAQSSTGWSQGTLPTINELGVLILSIMTINISSGATTFSYTGVLDGQTEVGLISAFGRRNGTWSQSGGVVSFVIGVSCGFS